MGHSPPPLLFLIDSSAIMQSRKARQVLNASEPPLMGAKICSAIERLVGHSPVGTDFAYQIVDSSYQNELNVMNTSPIQSVSQAAFLTLRESIMEKSINLKSSSYSVQLIHLAAAARDLLEATGEASYDSFLDTDNHENQRNILIIFSSSPSSDDEFEKFAPSLDETSAPHSSKFRMLLSHPTSTTVIWVDCSSSSTSSPAFLEWLSNQEARIVLLQSLIIDRRVMPARVAVSSVMRPTQSQVKNSEAGVDVIVCDNDAVPSLDVLILFRGKLSFITSNSNPLTNIILLAKYFVRDNALSDEDLSNAGSYSEPPKLISPQKAASKVWNALDNVWIENFAGLMIYMKKAGFVLVVDAVEMNGDEQVRACSGLIAALTPLTASLRTISPSTAKPELKSKILDEAFAQWISRQKTELSSIPLGTFAGSLKESPMLSLIPEWLSYERHQSHLDLGSERNSRYIAEVVECENSKSSNCLSEFYDDVLCSSGIDDGVRIVKRGAPCRSALLRSLKDRVLVDSSNDAVSSLNAPSTQAVNNGNNTSSSPKSHSPIPTKVDSLLNQTRYISNCERLKTLPEASEIKVGVMTTVPDSLRDQGVLLRAACPPFDTVEPNFTEVSPELSQHGIGATDCYQLSYEKMPNPTDLPLSFQAHTRKEVGDNLNLDMDVSISGEGYVGTVDVGNHETPLGPFLGREKGIEIQNLQSKESIEKTEPGSFVAKSEPMAMKSAVALVKSALSPTREPHQLNQTKPSELLQVDQIDDVDTSKSFWRKESAFVDSHNSYQQAIASLEANDLCTEELETTPFDNANVVQGMTKQLTKSMIASEMKRDYIPFQKNWDSNATKVRPINSLCTLDHTEEAKSVASEEHRYHEQRTLQLKDHSSKEIEKNILPCITDAEDEKNLSPAGRQEVSTPPSTVLTHSKNDPERKSIAESVVKPSSTRACKENDQLSDVCLFSRARADGSKERIHFQSKVQPVSPKENEASVELESCVSPLTLLLEAAAIKSGERPRSNQSRANETIPKCQGTLPNLYETEKPLLSGSRRNLIETLNCAHESDNDANDAFGSEKCPPKTTPGAVSNATMAVERTIREIAACSSIKSVILRCMNEFEKLAAAIVHEGHNQHDVRKAVKQRSKETDTVVDGLQNARQEMKKSTGLIDCEMSNVHWTAIMKAFEQVVWLSAAATLALRKNNRKRVEKIAKRVRTIISVTRVSVELGTSKKDSKELFEKCISELFFSVLKPFKADWSNDQPSSWLSELTSQFEFAVENSPAAEKHENVKNGRQVNMGEFPLREQTISRKRSRDKNFDVESWEELTSKRSPRVVSNSLSPQSRRKLDPQASRSSLKHLLLEYKGRKVAASMRGKERFSSIENRMRSGQAQNPLTTKVKLKIPKFASKRQENTDKEKRMDAWLDTLRNAPAISEEVESPSMDEVKLVKSSSARFALDESAMLLADEEDIFKCMSPGVENEGDVIAKVVEIDGVDKATLLEGKNLPWEKEITLAKHVPTMEADNLEPWEVAIELGGTAGISNAIVPETP